MCLHLNKWIAFIITSKIFTLLMIGIDQWVETLFFLYSCIYIGQMVSPVWISICYLYIATHDWLLWMLICSTWENLNWVYWKFSRQSLIHSIIMCQCILKTSMKSENLWKITEMINICRAVGYISQYYISGRGGGLDLLPPW